VFRVHLHQQRQAERRRLAGASLRLRDEITAFGKLPDNAGEDNQIHSDTKEEMKLFFTTLRACLLLGAQVLDEATIFAKRPHSP